MYAKIAQYDQKYQSKDFEYSIEVIVSEDVADKREDGRKVNKKVDVLDTTGI